MSQKTITFKIQLDNSLKDSVLYYSIYPYKQFMEKSMENSTTKIKLDNHLKDSDLKRNNSLFEESMEENTDLSLFDEETDNINSDTQFIIESKVSLNDSNIVLIVFRDDFKETIYKRFIAINPNCQKDEIILNYDKDFNLIQSNQEAKEATILDFNLPSQEIKERNKSRNICIDNVDYILMLSNSTISIPVNSFNNEHEIKLIPASQTYRTFDLTAKDSTNPIQLNLIGNTLQAENVDNADIKETTKLLSVKCNLDAANAFTINNKVYQLEEENKIANFTLDDTNKNFEIIFGHLDEQGKFLNFKKQIVYEFSSNELKTGINNLTVNDDNNFSCLLNDAVVNQKTINNEARIITEFTFSGIFAGIAAGLAIAAFAINLIAAIVLISAFAAISATLFIHGRIKKNRIYSPSENTSFKLFKQQKDDTSSEYVPQLKNWDDPELWKNLDSSDESNVYSATFPQLGDVVSFDGTELYGE